MSVGCAQKKERGGRGTGITQERKIKEGDRRNT